MLPVTVKDSALEDIQTAYEYLELQEKKVGEKLLQKITEYVDVISTNPNIFKPGYREVRQVRVKPFQYLLRYKVYKEYIVVIQSLHSKQHPKRKKHKGSPNG
ncbi:MAG: type II toxin-antitoxin system RelE/ParE family toxin [Bacteroidia bacterium]|jgi:plasmid stabilization system protein ParE|nr:type II toxin-antitoxin system RelE/ParE family toxin [Bacteroidia bacterium]